MPTVASRSDHGPDLLAEIVAAKRAEVNARRLQVREADLLQRARGHVRRPFAEALAQSGRAIIAEMKQASPSRGVLRADYRPAEIARAYEAAGARALSVLTDSNYFGGSLEHLGEAREACALPLLRKDFILHPYQLIESAAAGADAVLLIVAAVDDPLLRMLFYRAADLGLETLVEVHTEREAERAVRLGATLIGVNNRNLATLAVDIETSFRLRSHLPAGTLLVSESGLGSREDLDRLEAAGYRAFLVGEHFMSAADPGAALRGFLGAS